MQFLVRALSRRGATCPPLGAALCLALCLLGSVATSSRADPTPGPFDTTIEVENTEAPDGGVFRVTGLSSCDGTYVTLRYYQYSGEFDLDTQQATGYTGSDDWFHYSVKFVVPDSARPGEAALFADTGCGNPDAKPSPNAPVTIVKAAPRLTTSPVAPRVGDTITLIGDRCYGDEDGTVTVQASGAVTASVVARLTKQRYTATFRATRNGSATFTVTDPDCEGTNPAVATARIGPGPLPSPSATRTASTSPSSPSPSRSSPAAAATTPAPAATPSSTEPATLRTEKSRSNGATPAAAWLLIAIAAAGAAAGVLWRRRTRT